MMLKNAVMIVDHSTELGKDKICKNRHQNQTPYDDYITLDLLGYARPLGLTLWLVNKLP